MGDQNGNLQFWDFCCDTFNGVYFKYTPHLFSCFWNGVYFKYAVFWAKLHLLQVYYKKYEISILKVYFEYTYFILKSYFFHTPKVYFKYEINMLLSILNFDVGSFRNFDGTIKLPKGTRQTFNNEDVDGSDMSIPVRANPIY